MQIITGIPVDNKGMYRVYDTASRMATLRKGVSMELRNTIWKSAPLPKYNFCGTCVEQSESLFVTGYIADKKAFLVLGTESIRAYEMPVSEVYAKVDTFANVVRTEDNKGLCVYPELLIENSFDLDMNISEELYTSKRAYPHDKSVIQESEGTTEYQAMMVSLNRYVAKLNLLYTDVNTKWDKLMEYMTLNIYSNANKLVVMYSLASTFDITYYIRFNDIPTLEDMERVRELWDKTGDLVPVLIEFADKLQIGKGIGGVISGSLYEKLLFVNWCSSYTDKQVIKLWNCKALTEVYLHGESPMPVFESCMNLLRVLGTYKEHSFDQCFRLSFCCTPSSPIPHRTFIEGEHLLTVTRAFLPSAQKAWAGMHKNKCTYMGCSWVSNVFRTTGEADECLFNLENNGFRFGTPVDVAIIGVEAIGNAHLIIDRHEWESSSPIDVDDIRYAKRAVYRELHGTCMTSADTIMREAIKDIKKAQQGYKAEQEQYKQDVIEMLKDLTNLGSERYNNCIEQLHIIAKRERKSLDDIFAGNTAKCYVIESMQCTSELMLKLLGMLGRTIFIKPDSALHKQVQQLQEAGVQIRYLTAEETEKALTNINKLNKEWSEKYNEKYTVCEAYTSLVPYLNVNVNDSNVDMCEYETLNMLRVGFIA